MLEWYDARQAPINERISFKGDAHSVATRQKLAERAHRDT
jgi:hypothetical protein